MSAQIWLLDLPEACRSGGLDVSTFDGWETRSRSSGGYDALLGVGYHHDASSASSSDGSSDAYGWLYADDKPIGAMRLHRSGALVVGAAGATNTMGKGGPLTCSTGTVPLDRGNQTLIAIEAANNGVGEQWPKVEVDAYVALVAALCAWYGFDPARDIFGHFDYCAPSCPSRKIDPAGPAAAPYGDLRGPNSSGTWLLSAFRGHVAACTPDPTPTPPDPEPEDDDMARLYLAKLDTNAYHVRRGDGNVGTVVRSSENNELKRRLDAGKAARPGGACYYSPTTDKAIAKWADIPSISETALDLDVGYLVVPASGTGVPADEG